MVVMGAPGSGESTLAAALGAAGAPVFHLDQAYFSPGGRPWGRRRSAPRGGGSRRCRAG